jgi:hypothetical protein
MNDACAGMARVRPAALACLLMAMPVAWAHGGRTNATGCHNDRRSGGYHCHGAAPSSSRMRATPATPARDTPRDGAGLHAFANCTAARAAGAAPVRRGDPGYGPHLDRDDEGIGCE